MTYIDPQFLRAMGVLLGPPLLDGNRVTTLLNGDQIFPAMLQAIRSAQKTITFETYIYWSGTIGEEFAEALADRAKNGVKVHVILDWLGSQKMEEAQIDAMRKSGVEYTNTTRHSGTRSTGSTIARIANCWSSTAKSVSPAA